MKESVVYWSKGWPEVSLLTRSSLVCMTGEAEVKVTEWTRTSGDSMRKEYAVGGAPGAAPLGITDTFAWMFFSASMAVSAAETVSCRLPEMGMEPRYRGTRVLRAWASSSLDHQTRLGKRAGRRLSAGMDLRA